MNVPALLTRAVARFPHQPALIYGDRRWTYAEWMARIRRLAQALSNLGVRPSDRVAFCLASSEASVTTYFACHSHGNDVAIAMNCVMEYSLSRRDTALHVAPLYHVGGLQAYITPHVMVGATNVVAARYEPLRAGGDRDAADHHAVRGAHADRGDAPPSRLGEFDLSSLRMITTGGAAIASVTMQRVIQDMCPTSSTGMA